jgi:hypothetical protein
MSQQTPNPQQRPDQQAPRQVTVQPQEPAPWKGGPPKQPQRSDKGPRPAPEGEKDERNNKDRDGLA